MSVRNKVLAFSSNRPLNDFGAGLSVASRRAGASCASAVLWKSACAGCVASVGARAGATAELTARASMVLQRQSLHVELRQGWATPADAAEDKTVGVRVQPGVSRATPSTTPTRSSFHPLSLLAEPVTGGRGGRVVCRFESGFRFASGALENRAGNGFSNVRLIICDQYAMVTAAMKGHHDIRTAQSTLGRAQNLSLEASSAPRTAHCGLAFVPDFIVVDRLRHCCLYNLAS